MNNIIDFLTKDEVVFFKENGYLLVKNIFSKEKILQLKETCKKAAESDLKKIGHQLNSLHCITELSAYDGLRDLLYNPHILKILKKLSFSHINFQNQEILCFYRLHVQVLISSKIMKNGEMNLKKSSIDWN